MGIVESIAAHEAEKLAGVAIGGVTAGPAGAIIGFVKAYWKPLLVGIAAVVIALVVISHFANDRHVRKQLDGLTAWQNAVLGITAAEMPKGKDGKEPKIAPGDVVGDIMWLGHERARLAKALDDQSAKLRVAQAKAVSAQNSVTAALEGAKERDKARGATRAALIDPKRTQGLSEAEWGKL